MAARCAVCGKGPQTGFTVSHSHIRNKRTFRPNLQPVRTTIDGENVIENGYWAYHLDESSREATVLPLFYEKVR